jgi:hypothetical protein
MWRMTIVPTSMHTTAAVAPYLEGGIVWSFTGGGVWMWLPLYVSIQV